MNKRAAISVLLLLVCSLTAHAQSVDVNQRIARALDEARIPVVLLDRTVVPYPGRGHHDLVGIDNRRAGYVITEHLLKLGARRIAFLARPLRQYFERRLARFHLQPERLNRRMNRVAGELHRPPPTR